MERDRLKKLLEAKPLNHETSSVTEQALKRRVNEQQEVILYLAECLSIQAASIIDIRAKMNLQKGAIEAVAELAGGEMGPQPMIVMPDKPELVGVDGEKL